MKYCGLLLCVAGIAAAQELTVQHAECSLFGANMAKAGRTAAAGRRPELSALTTLVAAVLPAPPGGSRTADFGKRGAATEDTGTIDHYIFTALQSAGVAAAPPTNDYEFIRRVTLDLTGRIPLAARVTSFVADRAADKRARLIDELIARPEWLDKWAMFLGDLYQNNSSNSQIDRYPLGVKAFNDYVRGALESNKPYNQIATEMISASGTNSYTMGQLNYLVGGFVGGGPAQDIFDQQTANVFTQFMGMSAVNCLLCHNGRGHLDGLNLWATQTTRYQAWQLASYLSRTDTSRTPVSGLPAGNPYYWGLSDTGRNARTDYALNTTTGNRPQRQPIGNERNVAPEYFFNGDKPKTGETYRAALARAITSDIQFARATVNYFWAYFFGVGLVDPPDQFDPARLDPDHPPPDPWTLQPSNPRLLNALAQDLVDSKYDVKWLIRTIANSRAYQLSSRYEGTYNSSWDTLYARKFVRRLWAEEVHDAVAQSSNIVPSYPVAENGTLNWAMKFPEPTNTPSARAAVTQFLDAFLRGNRDDQVRSPDGSISQALDMMNDPFVMERIRANGPATSLLPQALRLSNDDLVTTLFLTVLSRNPSEAERGAALARLGAGNRNQAAENLLWSLYNKLDFLFNY